MTPRYPSPEQPYSGTFVWNRVESLRGAGVDVEVLVVRADWHKLGYAKTAWLVRRRLAEGGFDLVNGVYGYAGIIARTQWQVPVVATFCGSDVFGFVDERGRMMLRSRVQGYSSKVLSRFVDQVIVPSAEMAAQLPRRHDVHVIPHAVDFGLFSPTERLRARELLGLDADRNYLLFAASPAIHVKNYPLAEAAAARLREQGVENELLVVSKETQERLALYMSACDALVFTSYLEGSPNVVKQAMACNLPIVSTAVGDVPEVIGSTPGCHVCEPSPEALAARLREVLAEGVRTDGRDRIRHLDSGEIAQQVIGVYERALAGS